MSRLYSLSAVTFETLNNDSSQKLKKQQTFYQCKQAYPNLSGWLVKIEPMITYN